MKNFKKFLSAIFMLIIIALSIYFIKYFYDIYSAKKISNMLSENTVNEAKLSSTVTPPSNELQQDINIKNNIINEELPTQSNNENTITTDNNDTKIENFDNSNKIEKLKDLQKQNSDIVALIEIENTDINFPVVQGKDNTYYMKHNYKKQYSINGAIFLDKDYSWNPPSSNLLIYGHNNKNGTMFQSLLKYKNKSYFDKHPKIRFTTNSSDSIFDIFAVFESRVYYKSEQNVFRYYYFIDSENESEYNDFVNNAKSASLYDTGITPTYEEQLLTLSTCSYHVKDGRFVVIAKKA